MSEIAEMIKTMRAEIQKAHALEEKQDVLREEMNRHELACKDSGARVMEKFAILEGHIALLEREASSTKKMVWLVFASLAAFELNAIFKLVGVN